jgi:hypothetical protein
MNFIFLSLILALQIYKIILIQLHDTINKMIQGILSIKSYKKNINANELQSMDINKGAHREKDLSRFSLPWGEASPIWRVVGYHETHGCYKRSPSSP